MSELENKRKQMIFRSNHRGTKEMDLIMGGFANKSVPEFTESELAEYEALLTENDPDLYNWLTEKEPAPDNIASMAVFQKLMKFELV